MTSAALVIAAAGLARGLQQYRAIEFLHVPEVAPAPAGQPTNWLLVGSDSREGIEADDPNAGAFLGEPVEGKRTDTIIVARVDPELGSVDLLSVPRDLWVPIAGTSSSGRINSAFNGEGGEQRLVATVESFLDIEINNYAEIDFVGFQAIIDALGGVPIWFETPVRDPGTGLDVSTPGCHVLSGSDALAFARSRSLEYLEDGSWRTDPTGDLGRTGRQQFLLARLADTARNELDITDIATIDRILDVGGENLVIDDGAGAGDLIDLARTFANVGSEGIRRHSLPVENFRTDSGAAVLRLLEADAQPTLELFRGDRKPSPPEPSEDVPRDSFTVEVQNGARISGLAASTADELGAAGFVVDGIGNAPTPVEQTVIRHPSSLTAAAGVLGGSLAAPPRYEVDESLTRVVVVVGPDHQGLVPAEGPSAPVPPAEEPVESEVGLVPGPGPEGTPCA